MKMVALILVFAVSLSFGQKGSTLSSGQILKNIETNYAGIQDYTVELEVKADLERLRVPQMAATMYYKRPDKMRFVSDGFAMLPKEGFGFMSGDLSSRFDVDSVREEQPGYVLALRPKQDKKRFRYVIVAIDATTWTVTQMSTPAFEGRQMTALFNYQKVGTYLLPSKMKVIFMVDSLEADPVDPFSQLPANQRSPQIPRKGTIEILFSNYKLNTGLENAFFESNKDSSR